MNKRTNKFPFILLMILVIFGACILIYLLFDSSTEFMMSDNAIFYSVEDIEGEYSNSNKYKELMVADENKDVYIFSTIEDYTEAKVGIGCDSIVSGVFVDDGRYIYEIAVFKDGIHNDPEYYLLDTKYTVLYEVDTLVPIVEDENMIKELDSIEEQYEKLQEKNMVSYKDTKILSYDYVEIMIEKTANIAGIKYDEYKNMGIINKDDVFYYQVDFSYKDKNTIYLVNANTCDMIKIK